MPAAIDLTGQRFGDAVAQKYAGYSVRKNRMWQCLCDCGKTFDSSASLLRRGETTSCGCRKYRTPRHATLIPAGTKFGDLTVTGAAPSNKKRAKCSFVTCSCGQTTTAVNARLVNGKTNHCGCKTGRGSLLGQKFGRLTVIRALDKRIAGRHIAYECSCECGATTVVASTKLKSGHTRSCGCIHSETAAGNFKNDGHLAYANDPDHAARLSYIYLAEIDGAVDKIGIAFDVEKRGVYSMYSRVWWKRQMTRAQCWAVEQCALHLTREYLPTTPAGNVESGPSEQRTGWVLDDAITMIDQLCDECLEIGWRALYERYVLA